jgi:hypothetical protein
VTTDLQREPDGLGGTWTIEPVASHVTFAVHYALLGRYIRGCFTEHPGRAAPERPSPAHSPSATSPAPSPAPCNCAKCTPTTTTPPTPSHRTHQAQPRSFGVGTAHDSRRGGILLGDQLTVDLDIYAIRPRAVPLRRPAARPSSCATADHGEDANLARPSRRGQPRDPCQPEAWPSHGRPRPCPEQFIHHHNPDGDRP